MNIKASGGFSEHFSVKVGMKIGGIYPFARKWDFGQFFGQILVNSPENRIKSRIRAACPGIGYSKTGADFFDYNS